MEELYWITRLDALSGWLIAFATICGFVLLVSIVGFLIQKDKYMCVASESNKEWMIFFSKLFKIFMPSFILLIILNIITPTTRQALLIYGVGTTIDYIKNNETAKQLPDKCINALDVWVESLTQEEKKEKKGK